MSTAWEAVVPRSRVLRCVLMFPRGRALRSWRWRLPAGLVVLSLVVSLLAMVQFPKPAVAAPTEILFTHSHADSIRHWLHDWVPAVVALIVLAVWAAKRIRAGTGEGSDFVVYALLSGVVLFGAFVFFADLIMNGIVPGVVVFLGAALAASAVSGSKAWRNWRMRNKA